MKTKQLLFSLIFVLVSMITYAETIAVANFSTTGLHVTPEIAAKLTRLELIKLQKHTVLDEFDMNEILSKKPEYVNCYGKTCLVELGKDLNVDYILSGSVDCLGNKIVITLKLIDVKNNTLKATHSQEFLNQEEELQRMIALVLQETFGVDSDPTVKSRLEFKNDVITSTTVGKLSNAGPRMGVSYVAFGGLNTFFTRNENQGGLGIKPIMSNIGYQFED
jgi:TolB-like protein